MALHSLRRKAPLARLALLACAFASVAESQRLDPIRYIISVPDPASHVAVIEARVPAGKKADLDLMMPVWSPGFYRVEDYAGKVQDFAARAPDGTVLAVEKPQPNRWRVSTNGAAEVVITYRLLCAGRSVTTNWVGEDMGVFNGSATYITLVEPVHRPHEVHIVLPPQWPQAMTSLVAPPGAGPAQWRADDYDMLNDSPIVAGTLSVHEFSVDRSAHYLVDAGTLGAWDGDVAARNIRQFVRADSVFWGTIPFKKYVFLNLFRQGGGGLEHLNSTLLTSRFSPAAPGGNVRWLNFVSHEYFHAFNVKRLRPVELGPFDYERPPSTGSLWISEGLTSYFGELLVARAGLETPADYLASLSAHIRSVQNSPGRLVQTLEQSSLNVWTAGTSGVGQDTMTTISYYEKGPIVGFLLDARIRARTNDRQSLDDVMRAAYRKYGAARGFTPEEFQKVAERTAGENLKEFFRRALYSTEELDYSEALSWFGLRFKSSDDKIERWTLEPRPDATDVQKTHFKALVGLTIDKN